MQNITAHINQDTVHGITIVHPLTPQQMYEVYDRCRFVNAFDHYIQALEYRQELLDQR